MKIGKAMTLFHTFFGKSKSLLATADLSLLLFLPIPSLFSSFDFPAATGEKVTTKAAADSGE